MSVEPLRFGDGSTPYADLPTLAPQPKDIMISTAELVERTGATYRQIDYWCTNGLIPTGNPGSGNKRAFDPDIVSMVSVMVRVSKALPHRTKARVPLALLESVRDALGTGCVELGHGVRICWDEVPTNQPIERNTP